MAEEILKMVNITKRFAGPVFPGQHMDFPLVAGKLYTVQGRYSGKPFCYIDHF